MPNTYGPFYPSTVSELSDGEASLSPLSNLTTRNDTHATFSQGGAGSQARDTVVKLAGGANKGQDDDINGINQTTDVEPVYGGSNDTWTLSLSPSVVNDPGFNVDVQVGIGGGGVLNTLRLSGFGANVPGTETVTGVSVVPKWHSDLTGDVHEPTENVYVDTVGILIHTA